MDVSLTNYARTAASITAASEAPGYPASRIAYATAPFQPYRSGVAGAGQSVTIDLGSAKAVEVIALGRLNVTSLTIQADDAPTFNSGGGTPQFTQALTAAEALNGRYHVSHRPGSAITRRYWRVVIANQTPIATFPHAAGVGFYLIGWLWLGPLAFVPRDIMMNPDLERQEPVSDLVLPSQVRSRSRAGYDFVTLLARRQAELDAAGLDTQLRQWLALDRAWSEVDAALVLPTTVAADAYVMRRLTGPKFTWSVWSEGDLVLEEIVG